MQEQRPDSQPEIDLFYFLRPISSFLKKTGHRINYYFLKLRANLLLFFTIIILSGVVGYLLKFINPRVYDTEAIYISRVIPAKMGANMINDLNNSALQVDRELKISPSAAASIRKIEAKESGSIDARRVYDSLLYNNNGDSALKTIKISLFLYNQQYLDTLQQALVNYIENSPFAIKRTEARKEALLKLRSSLTAKLASMDSVQQVVNSSIEPHREYIPSHPINPVDVYKATYFYNKQKILIDQELSIMDNVEVLQPFTRFARFNYPNYLYLFLLALTIGLGVSLILTPLLGKKPKIL